MTARREGKTVSVVVDGQAQAEQIQDAASVASQAAAKADAEELEGLDDDIKQVVKLLDKKLTETIAPLTNRLAAIEGIAENYQKADVDKQIKDVKDKHKDFAKHQKSMAKIARETPGLAVEEMYLIAKARAGDLKLEEASTHSERPTPTPRQRETKAKRELKTEGMSSKRAFQIHLADALDQVDFTPREE